jgi:hypothetical protein
MDVQKFFSGKTKVIRIFIKDRAAEQEQHA